MSDFQIKGAKKEAFIPFGLPSTYYFFFEVSTVTVVLTALSLITCIVSLVTTFEVSLVLTSSVVLLVPPVQAAKETVIIAIAKNAFLILFFLYINYLLYTGIPKK